MKLQSADGEHDFTVFIRKNEDVEKHFHDALQRELFPRDRSKK